MNVVLWSLQIVVGLVMAMAGGMKVMQGKDKLLEDPRMAWAGDYSDSTIRGIGAVEVLAAIGLIFPWWFDIAPMLTPLAAVGVVAIQVGAAATHIRRKEMQMVAMNAMLGILALVVAIGRFGDL